MATYTLKVTQHCGDRRLKFTVPVTVTEPATIGQVLDRLREFWDGKLPGDRLTIRLESDQT